MLPEEGLGEAQRLTEQQLRKVIQKKLVTYKRRTRPKGCDSTSISITSSGSRRPNLTAVPLVLCSYGLISENT